LKHTPTTELSPKTDQEGGIYCLYDSEKIDEFSSQMLEPEYWQKQNLVVSQAVGRGTTWFVNYKGDELALRHYYRGGLVAKLIKDTYLFSSYGNTRAVAEFNLLVKLIALDLPVPQPVACRVTKSSFFYRADLLTTRIKNAEDVVTILCKKSLAAEIWQKIGATIKTFHQQGIFHHDLNAHNLLIDNNFKVWLIDFDKGRQRSIDDTWPNQNLARLKRSLFKELHKLEDFHFQESDFEELLKGYQNP